MRCVMQTPIVLYLTGKQKFYAHVLFNWVYPITQQYVDEDDNDIIYTSLSHGPKFNLPVPVFKLHNTVWWSNVSQVTREFVIFDLNGPGSDCRFDTRFKFSFRAFIRWTNVFTCENCFYTTRTTTTASTIESQTFIYYSKVERVHITLTPTK